MFLPVVWCYLLMVFNHVMVLIFCYGVLQLVLCYGSGLYDEVPEWQRHNRQNQEAPKLEVGTDIGKFQIGGAGVIFNAKKLYCW